MLKRIIALLLFAITVFSLFGCGALPMGDNGTTEREEESLMYQGEKTVFSWMPYMQLEVTEDLSQKKDYENYIRDIFSAMKDTGVEETFVQVRPFGDSFYPSEVYPVSSYAEKAQGFDPFGVIMAIAKEFETQVHAWINPYRLDKSCLEDKQGIFYDMYNEAPCETVVRTASGVYLNPCSPRAQELILEGAEEILEKYPVKGIHIDDYFYPEDFADSDEKQYADYKKSGGKGDIGYFRRESVNSLVTALYSLVKSYGEEKVFSISPAGNTDKCYNEFYADIYSWAEGGYCDMLLPQIYFGFENETLPFRECLQQWLDITNTHKVELYPALALYKAGQQDAYAGKGEREWQENSDIIVRQAVAVLNSGCRGFALYSSAYINFSETFLSQELNNLKSVL